MDSLLLTHQVVVQLLSRAQLFAIPGFPVLHYLPEFAQTNVHEVSDAIQPSHPVTTTSSCPQSFPASGSFPMSCLFPSGSQSIRTSASASVPPVNILGWLISFRIDWFALQVTLKSLLPHQNLKTSVLHTQPFLWSNFHIQCMTIVKTIAFTIQTFEPQGKPLKFFSVSIRDTCQKDCDSDGLTGASLWH